ncbi:unnamed protein product [Colias eurytheme]|nr:unnamed protein product [Colias eurytheme]
MLKTIFNVIFFFYRIAILNRKHAKIDERPGDDDGRGAGVRDPADDDRQTALRPGGEDHRPAGGLVLRPPVHRLEG